VWFSMRLDDTMLWESTIEALRAHASTTQLSDQQTA
jgi:hypothetical protein